MAVTVVIDSFYQSNAVTDPPTYQLTYTVTWGPSDTVPASLLVWGPQGVGSDTIAPTNLIVANGVASFTNTINVAQQNTYTPLVSDPTFHESSWTTQSLYVQPGTYTLVVDATSITVNGFPFQSGHSFTVVDAAPVVVVLTGTPSLITVTGTPSFPPVTDLLDNTPQPADFYPLYVVVTDAFKVVISAVYAINAQPYTGSPQALTSPLLITDLDNTLTPIPTPPTQPSSALNNT